MTFTGERFILGVCCGDARETAGLKLPPFDTAGDAACFSSQFSSRWYLYARNSPYTLHTVSEVSPTLPLKQVAVAAHF